MTSSPVKCNCTNRPIHPGEKNSVQILLAKLNNSGMATGSVKIINLSGGIRCNGNSDKFLYDSECCPSSSMTE